MSEKERIQNVDTWPLWPRLPVKKRVGAGFPPIGFLIADQVQADGPITVYYGNVFGGGPSEKGAEFVSLDAMLKDGWVGD